MDEIDAALASLEDSLECLAARLRGTEAETLGLFRARLMLDDTQGLIAAARANGAIGGGWGGELVPSVVSATLLVAIVPGEGGPPFGTAMASLTEALTAIRDALDPPDPAEDAAEDLPV